MHTPAPVSVSPSAPVLTSVLDRIRGWAAANGWKPATLARMAGVAERVTRDMDSAVWSPSSSSIRRFEALIPDEWRVGDALPEAAPSETHAEPATTAAE